jgi:membrane-bound acyltransferase YfiQ involved in biofilm formation
MAQPMAESRAEHDEESRQERVNRELIELLNELRVALPGVQVLFAFLLTVPFSNGYNRITGFQKDVYFAILVATAISTACFIVPTAYHRLNFRKREKEQILISSNRFAIAGIMSLALSMVGVLVLIADIVYSDAAAVVAGVLALVVFGGLWAVLPLVRRDNNA